MICLEKVNNGDSIGDRQSTASCLYDRESKTDGNAGLQATPDKAIPRSQVENIFQCYVKIL